MIHNHVIQEDLITKLKADAAILAFYAALPDGFTVLTADIKNVIKEAQYTRSEIQYPALRVKLFNQIPIVDRGPCEHTRLNWAVYVFSEERSSMQSDILSGLVTDLFHGSESGGKKLTGTGWYSYFRSTGLPKGRRVTERLWRAEPAFSGVIYPSA